MKAVRDQPYGAVRHRRPLHGTRAPSRGPGRMLNRQRAAIYGIIGGLWFSGCLWLALDQFLAQPGQFGPMPHPWQPRVLLVHGILAIAAMYLLGWVTARHVLRWWPGRLRRASGGAVAALLVLLVVTGFALFFLSDDRWMHSVALSHDALGLIFTLFGVQHGFFAKRRDMRSAASRP
ncbi:MAG: hypothetical protein M3O41_12845 [Pseudomonadota bacterium]|nr:hypothetical protein [Pseudomonadota bacterium]